MISNDTTAYIKDLNVDTLAISSMSAGTGILEVTAGVIGVVPAGVNGNVLTTTGGGVSWANPPVSSVFGRTNAVTAQNGDYSISQITNASTLADSANVNISLPVPESYLYYTGLQWINRTSNFYSNVVNVSGTTTPATFNAIHVCSNATITMPTAGLSDIGKRILIFSFDATNITVDFPAGVFLTNTNTSGFTMNSANGSIEFVVTGTTRYAIVGCSSPSWKNPVTGGSFAPLSLSDLPDLSIATPNNGDLLRYNSTSLKWEKSPNKVIYYFNSVTDILHQRLMLPSGQTLVTGKPVGSYICPGNTTKFNINVVLSDIPGGGSGYEFEIFGFGSVPTGYTLTMSDTTQFAQASFIVPSGSFTANEFFGVQARIVNTPTAAIAQGYVEVEYYLP